MARFVVTAVGADRPGIVAAVTGVLMDVGGNLEDTEMAVLGGQFAMMLVVAAPDASAASLEGELAPVAEELDLAVAVRPIADTAAGVATGEEWSVTVYGGDKPGIVHRVASLLADRGVNITGAETRVVGPADQPVYAMLLDIVVPAEVDGAAVAAQLAEAAKELGVDCQMAPADADIL